MLHVVQIQKSINSTGRAPLRLHRAFREHDTDSSILSLEYTAIRDGSIADTGRNSRIRSRLNEFLASLLTRSADNQLGLYSFPILGTDVSRHRLIRDADVIYLHWVQGGFLNLSNYRQIASLGKPVVIYMHDMWSVTGGCHHSFACEKYETGCRRCPIFNKPGMIDWADIEFKRKKKLYENFKNLHFVSPSLWLYDCTKRSLLTRDKPVYHIPNIIDANLFKPVDKLTARRILNLNEDEIIVGFGAFELGSAYKGWSELVRALNILHRDQSYRNLTILVFGSGNTDVMAESVPFRMHYMGFLRDEYSTVLVYNAIDVFVTPSLADNFPTTVLESQACGTPVVGFDVGGIPELITHKENGYLARYKDAGDLAEGIRFCIDHKIAGKLKPGLEKDNLLGKHLDLISKITN